MRHPSSVSSDAFEAFFAAHRAEVLSYIRRRSSTPNLEDALSETFIVAWRRWNQIPADALPWLLGVARKVLANQRRSESRQLALVTRLCEAVISEPGWQPPATLSPALGDALAALSHKEREALLLSAWEGLDSERAAIVLGCTPAAFRARLHRARASAQAHLSALQSPRLVSCGSRPEEVR